MIPVCRIALPRLQILRSADARHNGSRHVPRTVVGELHRDAVVFHGIEKMLVPRRLVGIVIELVVLCRARQIVQIVICGAYRRGIRLRCRRQVSVIVIGIGLHLFLYESKVKYMHAVTVVPVQNRQRDVFNGFVFIFRARNQYARNKLPGAPDFALERDRNALFRTIRIFKGRKKSKQLLCLFVLRHGITERPRRNDEGGLCTLSDRNRLLGINVAIWISEKIQSISRSIGVGIGRGAAACTAIPLVDAAQKIVGGRRRIFLQLDVVDIDRAGRSGKAYGNGIVSTVFRRKRQRNTLPFVIQILRKVKVQLLSGMDLCAVRRFQIDASIGGNGTEGADIHIGGNRIG